MTENVVTEEIQGYADQTNDTKKFSFKDIIANVTYPEGKVSVITDGRAAQAFADLLTEEDDLQIEQKRLEEEFSGDMTGVPEEQDLKPRLEEIEREKQALLDTVLKSQITFHMRGLAPKAVEIISKEARRKFPIKNKSTEEEYEANIQAEDYISIEMVSKSIIKVVNSEGAEDTSVWRYEDVEALKENLFRTEYDKLDGMAGKLFSGKALATAQVSADFLPNS